MQYSRVMLLMISLAVIHEGVHAGPVVSKLAKNAMEFVDKDTQELGAQILTGTLGVYIAYTCGSAYRQHCHNDAQRVAELRANASMNEALDSEDTAKVLELCGSNESKEQVLIEKNCDSDAYQIPAKQKYMQELPLNKKSSKKIKRQDGSKFLEGFVYDEQAQISLVCNPEVALKYYDKKLLQAVCLGHREKMLEYLAIIESIKVPENYDDLPELEPIPGMEEACSRLHKKH